MGGDGYQLGACSEPPRTFQEPQIPPRKSVWASDGTCVPAGCHGSMHTNIVQRQSAVCKALRFVSSRLAQGAMWLPRTWLKVRCGSLASTLTCDPWHEVQPMQEDKLEDLVCTSLLGQKHESMSRLHERSCDGIRCISEKDYASVCCVRVFAASHGLLQETVENRCQC